MNFIQPISKEIFKTKYMINGEQNEDEVFHLIAKEIASCEKDDIQEDIENKFYNILSSTEFIPGGRILANARPTSKVKNYNNCFTIDIEDSMEGIYESLKEDAIISKVGGGVGFNISKLRPKGEKISKGGESSGPISFVRVFNESAKAIHTGGGRRGAHIAVLNIDHPDIEEFITIKQGDKNKELTQFNISVGITDKFMQSVKDNKDWDLQFNGKIYKTLKARSLYNLITKNAFEHNEPGVFFLDTAEKYNNGWWAFKLNQINPCGEITMPVNSLCCLGALNLPMFIRNEFEDSAYFDIERFKQVIEISIRFLDNVLDVTDYPLLKIKTISQKWRRIGLGFTGFGDTLSMLKYSYDSQEAIDFSNTIGTIFRDYSYTMSSKLAHEKGSFPDFNKEKIMQSNFIKQLPFGVQENIKYYGLRNIALLTTAPTGTISLSVGNNCSSGIEPIFSLQYDRTIRINTENKTKSEKVYDYAWLRYLEWIRKNNLTYTDVPNFFKTTLDIDPYKSIDIQATWQKYIDHSISKTANLPMNYTLEEYQNLFMYAYDNGLKGFTSFNPMGSMKGILEHTENSFITRRRAPKRPIELECDIHEISVMKEKYIILVGKLEDSLYEIFVNQNNDNQINIESHKHGIIKKVKKGKYDLIIRNGNDKVIIEDLTESFDPTLGTLARFISMSLRHGTPLQFIVEQLSKNNNFIGFERSVARVLKKYIKDGEIVLSSQQCPECGEKLKYIEGCVSCSCGWSKCI